MKKKPSKEKESNIFTEIDLQIMICNEKIKNHKRSIEKAKRMCGWDGPSEVGGIDYSRESSHEVHISFMQGLEKIKKDEERLIELKKERDKLRRERKRIEKIQESLVGSEAELYYNRVIMKRTQQKAAEDMNVCVRHVQRIEEKLKEKGVM